MNLLEIYSQVSEKMLSKGLDPLRFHDIKIVAQYMVIAEYGAPIKANKVLLRISSHN